MPKRIVACQGPIQLVAAVTVLRQRDRDTAKAATWHDHLVITGLAAPVGQEEAFVAALKKMAGALRSWTMVSHVPDIERLERYDDVAEVLVVREWQRSNEALLAAFPRAKKICFGDSIGIYLSPDYMAPEPGWMSRLARRLARSSTPRAAPNADCYYLSLPHAFGQPPSSDIRATDTALLRQAISDLTPLVPEQLATELRARLGNRRLVVFVTSNFSEQGVMTADAELTAYMQYFQQQSFDPGSLVLLKPHPRDRREKALKIEAELRKTFHNVFALTDAVASYLPLEALVLRIRPQQESHLGIDLCTFSSACLAAKHILGVQPRIGFGAPMVKRYFVRQFVKPRMRHESQLVKACA